MVICIGEKLLTTLPNSLEAFYNDNPDLKVSADNFRKQDVIKVNPECYLYVPQGKFAVIPSSDSNIKIVGSDEATTCHILILKHSSGTCAVTHLDGVNLELDEIFKEILKIEGNLELLDAYIIGGYTAPPGSKVASKDESNKLSLKLLNTFMHKPFKINLALWCTCSCNTIYHDNEPFPAVYGLAMDRHSNTVFPASFSNLCFCYKLHSALYWLQHSAKFYNLYDYKEKSITIPLFPEWNQENFGLYANLPDHIILKYFSTSPSVESPQFVQNLRGTFRLLATESQETLFPKGTGRKFTIGDSGKWQEI